MIPWAAIAPEHSDSFKIEAAAVRPGEHHVGLIIANDAICLCVPVDFTVQPRRDPREVTDIEGPHV